MNQCLEIGLRLRTKALTTLMALLPLTALAQRVEGPAFDPDANGSVSALALQPDGKIVIGGDFTQLDWQARNRIARLNANGSLDAGFNPSANNWVGALALQPDGKIVIGGGFTRIGGQVRNYIARLLAGGGRGVVFLNTPIRLLAGECGALTLGAYDESGALATAGAPTEFLLTTDSPAGSFFADAGCTVPIVSLAIDANVDGASFYYRDDAKGIFRLKAYEPSGQWNQGSVQIVIE